MAATSSVWRAGQRGVWSIKPPDRDEVTYRAFQHDDVAKISKEIGALTRDEEFRRDNLAMLGHPALELEFEELTRNPTERIAEVFEFLGT